MADLSALSRNPELQRRAVITLGLLAVYAIGCWVPLPGVDVSRLLGPTPVHNTAVARLSIMSLGMTPLLSAFVLLEVALIAAPQLREWSAKANNRELLFGWGTVVGLLLAALQANGIAVALEEIHGLVVTPGLTFRAGVVVSLVGATALLVWLSSLISRHGIGHGFWVLVAVPHAASFSEALVAQASHWGAAGPIAVAISIGFLALAAALFWTLSQAAPPLADTEEILWAIVLGFMAATWLLLGQVVVLWLAGGDARGLDIDGVLQSRSAILLPAVTVPIFVLLRRRSFAVTPLLAPVAPLALTMAALVAGGLALAYLPDPPLFPGPYTVLMLAAVGVAIAAGFSQRAASGTTEHPV